MRGLAYGVGGYVGLSFIYSLTNKEHVKAAPKKEEVHHAAPAVARSESLKAGTAAQHAVAAAGDHDQHNSSNSTSGKQQVAPVLQQLNAISDRLSKIEKALGI